MWQYNFTPSSDELYHFGTKGMKWGYNDGVRNGKTTARERYREEEHEYERSYNTKSISSAMARDRANEYHEKAQQEAHKPLKKRDNKKLGYYQAKRSEYNKLSFSEAAQASNYKRLYETAKKNREITNGIGYTTGYIAGRFVRASRKNINKGRNRVSKILRRLKKRR